MARKLQEIFEHVIDLEPAQRDAYLAAACAEDAQLRAQVEGLLRAHDNAAKFMASPTVVSASAVTVVTPLREGPGTRIGPYKLLQLIGEGGFGSVFMAEQERPVARKVALKIIKLGMDTRQVVARFEQERQALALMDHPNIAKVLDAGATETGRPFFVMELVKGDPIVEYADKNNLSVEERLDLFAQVCNAVQHAHTKGVIHRDLKPSNILVSTQDGRPHTKVIDFGIAKATASKLTEKTLFTEHRQLIGTPEYMSPEQAEGNLDIDTRTDVYSLGVLLYELLTGTTPFSSSELRSAAYAEIQRIIREVEPPKPSTRLSTNTDSITTVAARRRTEPKRLGTIVRGELDWIVMKALEKDRQRRYESASGLGLDVQRYLIGEAVLAAPPSTSYRIKKLIRRNKGPVIAGSTVAAALLVGVVAFAWQFKVARDQRDLAVQAEQAEFEQRRQADAARAEAVQQQAEAEKQEARAKAEEAKAKDQAAIAQAVATFQTQMLAAVDPANLPRDPATGEPLKDTVTVVQAIEAAVKRLDADSGGEGSLKDQPLVEARVRDTIGNTLLALGRSADAEPNLRRSLALRRAALPAGHPDIGVGLNNLAVLLWDQNKLDEAESLLRETLEIVRKAIPADDQITANTLDNLSKLLQDQKKLAEAEPLMREALALRRASLPTGHPDIALGLNNLAVLLRAQDKLAEAEPLYREALALRRATLPAGHPMIAQAMNNLASLLRSQSQPAEAEILMREAVQILRAALPAGHPDIARVLSSLAVSLQDQGKLAEAEPLYREALQIRRASLPSEHPQIAASLSALAGVLQDQGNPAEAEPLLREALMIYRDTPSPSHSTIATTLTTLARAQHALGNTAEARASFNEAIAMLRTDAQGGSVQLARVLWHSGAAHLETKNHPAALRDLQEAVTMAEKFMHPDDKQLKDYRDALAQCQAAIAGTSSTPGNAVPQPPTPKGGE